MTVQQVYRDALNGGFQARMMGKYDEMRIADVLKRVLGLTKARIMAGGSRSWKWVQADTAERIRNGTFVHADLEEDFDNS